MGCFWLAGGWPSGLAGRFGRSELPDKLKIDSPKHGANFPTHSVVIEMDKERAALCNVLSDASAPSGTN